MAGARSTRASTAVTRLKERTGNEGYSMSITGSGHFTLSEEPGGPALCAPMELDDFVEFVKKLGPQQVRKVSKLDVAFEKQLVKKKPEA
jgi:hypothetical protein